MTIWEHLRSWNSLPDTGSVLGWLLSVELFRELDAKLEEVDELEICSHVSMGAGTVSVSQELISKLWLTSAAASISACQTFLPWPSMTDAQSSALYFVEMRSAALRKMAALLSVISRMPRLQCWCKRSPVSPRHGLPGDLCL